jgi:ABC-2 type transport system permease protein
VARSPVNAVFILWLRQLKRYFRLRARMIGSLGQPTLFRLALGFGLGPTLARAGGGLAFGAATDFAVLGLLAAILLAIGAWLFSRIEV